MRNFVKSTPNFKSLLIKPQYGLYIHEYQAYDLLKKYQLPLVPVIHILFRALELAHQKMHTPSLKELWLMFPRVNLLLMLLLRLRFMQVEEAKEHLKKAHLKVVYRWPPKHHRCWNMLKR